VPPFGGLRSNVHGSSMARRKARGQLPISANWTFLLALTVDALSAAIGRSRCVQKGGWVTFSANLRKNGASPPTTLGVRKIVPGLSRGVDAWSYV